MDRATTPVVASANASPCSSKPGNAGTHRGYTTAMGAKHGCEQKKDKPVTGRIR